MGTAVILLSDQPPIPAQNGVGCRDAGNVIQRSASQFLTSHGEATALSVGEPKSSTPELLAEDPILRPEIVDQIFLVAVHPPGEGEQEELKCMGHQPRLCRLARHRR